MIQLARLQAPLGALDLMLDGARPVVKQNQLTVATGYNKFLSRSRKRGSGLGKYLHGPVLIKLGNVNYLDVRLLVDNVLPDFLQHFWGLINGQKSRKGFFKGRTPDEIYQHGQEVYTLLKEWLTMCDATSQEMIANNEAIRQIKPVVLTGERSSLGEVIAPNDTRIELFAVKGSDKIFAHAAQVAVATGTYRQSGATSDCTLFTKAVYAVATYYSLTDSNNGTLRCLAAEDVPNVLTNYRYIAGPDHWQMIDSVCDWWKDKILPTLPDLVARHEPTKAEPVAKEVFEQFAATFGLERKALAQMLSDIKRERFEQEQALLRERFDREQAQLSALGN